MTALPEAETKRVCLIITSLRWQLLFWRVNYTSSSRQPTFQVEAFSPTMFFLILLPPIIFESGYNLHKGNFFQVNHYWFNPLHSWHFSLQNIGSILVFAILGTAISALVVGGGIYLLGLADVVYPLTFVQSFAFGSLISAVDPVATLAIFQVVFCFINFHILVSPHNLAGTGRWPNFEHVGVWRVDSEWCSLDCAHNDHCGEWWLWGAG